MGKYLFLVVLLSGCGEPNLDQLKSDWTDCNMKLWSSGVSVGKTSHECNSIWRKIESHKDYVGVQGGDS